MGENHNATYVISGPSFRKALEEGLMGKPKRSAKKKPKRKKKKKAITDTGPGTQTPLILPCSCGFYKNDAPAMLAHKSQCDGKPMHPGQYTCGACGHQAPTLAEIMEHDREKHGGKASVWPTPPPPLPNQSPLPFPPMDQGMRERLVRTVYRSCIRAALNEQVPALDAVGVGDVVDTVETMVDDVLSKED
jgi:hypothetical protein